MKRKILKNTSVLVVLSMVLTFLLMIILLYNQSHSQMEEMLRTEAGYLKIAVDDMGTDYLGTDAASVSPSRITLIGSDGTVLYDSVEDAQSMENHGDRPEVQEAVEKGSGTETRLSATLGEETYYYAQILTDGSVIRVSRTTDSVLATVKDCIVPLALIFIAVLVVAVFLISRQTESLVAPLNKLDLEHPLDNDIYEEMSPLLTRINQQNEQIDRQMTALREKQEEYETITENMKDGLIVTDTTAVLSINKKALELFQVTKEECVQKNLLTISRNEALKNCLDRALAGDHSEATVDVDDRTYQILGNPVCVEGKIRGAVIFLLDVTEKSQSERMRREFTANVSHELKTPLMSISGYAELIMNNMVKPDNIQDFAGRIYQEANRLSSLVADIIKLSKLDEQQSSVPMDENVELWPLATDVTWQLQQLAVDKKVRVKLEGEPSTIRGNSQLLREILYNLCENAIKYNVEDGKVTLGIYPTQREVKIMVEDTGLGIPVSEQERIFERFYRVDKSHSNEIEGTGLGLSIVKHGVALHRGRIDMESTPGKGTRITVILPKA